MLNLYTVKKCIENIPNTITITYLVTNSYLGLRHTEYFPNATL